MKALFKTLSLRLTALVLSGVVFTAAIYPGLGAAAESEFGPLLTPISATETDETNITPPTGDPDDPTLGTTPPDEPEEPDDGEPAGEEESGEEPTDGDDTGEEPGESTPEPGTDEPGSEDASADSQSAVELEDKTSVIVYTFEQLRTYLVDANGFTTVYLGADIQMEERGVHISSASRKTEITIDGCPPGAPEGTRFTLTDYPAKDGQSRTIYLMDGSGIRYATLRNIVVEGYNWFGPMCVQDNLRGVTLTFENFKYTGPQPAFNLYGTTRFIDVDITTTDEEEIVETSHVEFHGNITIKHNINAKRVDAVMRLYQQGGTVTFAEGTNVAIDTNYDFIECVGSEYRPTITVEPNAHVTIISQEGMTRSGVDIGAMTLGVGAHFSMVQTKASGRAVILIYGDLSVDSGASFEVYNQSGEGRPAVTMSRTGAAMTFTNPARVVLYSKGISPLYFAGSGTLDIKTQGLNIANAGTNTGDDGGNRLPDDTIDGKLDGVWSRRRLQSFSLKASYTNFRADEFEHTLTDNDPNPIPLNITTFDLNNMRYLAFGSFLFDVDPIFHNSEVISGRTYGGAELSIHYVNDAMTQTLDGRADGSGRFSVAVPDSPLTPDIDVTFTAHHNRLRVRYVTEVELHETIAFHDVPPTLTFEHTTITYAPRYVYRADDSFSVGVIDTRVEQAPWYVYASIREPLTAVVEGAIHTLPGALTFVSDGERKTLTATPTLVYTGNTGADDPVTYITWARDQGPLIYLSSQSILPEVVYSTTIEWTLLDTPA